MPVKDIEFQSVEDVIQQIRDMNVKGGSPFGRRLKKSGGAGCLSVYFDYFCKAESDRWPAVPAASGMKRAGTYRRVRSAGSASNLWG